MEEKFFLIDSAEMLFEFEDDLLETCLSAKGCTICSHTCSGGTKIGL